MMELIRVLLYLVCMLATLTVALIVLLNLLIVICYLPLYFGDVIFGNFFEKKIERVNFSHSKIAKSFSVLLCIFKQRNGYLRYETPMFSFVFSYFGILILSMMGGDEYLKGYTMALVVYLLVYFIGMRRKYTNDELYKSVLESNKRFLKLSFIPLGFIVTLIGFIIAIQDKIDVEGQIDIERFFEEKVNVLFKVLYDYPNLTFSFSDIYNIVIRLFLLILLFYIVSLPVQFIAYFIIEILIYLCDYKGPYIKVLERELLLLQANGVGDKMLNAVVSWIRRKKE